MFQLTSVKKDENFLTWYQHRIVKKIFLEVGVTFFYFICLNNQ